jgi:hypothetical protein
MWISATPDNDWRVPELMTWFKSHGVLFSLGILKEGIMALVNINVYIPHLELFKHVHYAVTGENLVMDLIMCLKTSCLPQCKGF